MLKGTWGLDGSEGIEPLDALRFRAAPTPRPAPLLHRFDVAAVGCSTHSPRKEGRGRQGASGFAGGGGNRYLSRFATDGWPNFPISNSFPVKALVRLVEAGTKVCIRLVHRRGVAQAEVENTQGSADNRFRNGYCAILGDSGFPARGEHSRHGDFDVAVLGEFFRPCDGGLEYIFFGFFGLREQ